MPGHHPRSYVPVMSRTRPPHDDPSGSGQYRISVQGHLAQRWADWFDGLRLTNESDGTTVLQGVVVDQAALHGLLQKVRDTGLPLVSVTRTGGDEDDTSAPEPPQAPPDPRAPSS
jgi:hypothetical protein